MTSVLNEYLNDLPLIAILRGITPEDCEAVTEALFAAGFRMVEVPLNSPQALRSIERIAHQFGDVILVGAGTVLAPEQVHQVREKGGRLIVAPNTNLPVIQAGVEAEMVTIPGAATPTEAFAGIQAGANGVKVFPAEAIGPQVLASWRAVIPDTAPLLPVGGIDSHNMSDYWQAGAAGFGIGGALYKVGKSLGDISASATKLVWSATSLTKTM